MKKSILFTFLILWLLLAACSRGEETSPLVSTEIPPIVEPTAETATVELGDLTGVTWTWIGFTNPTEQFAVERPLNYTLSFQNDDTIAVVADCNNALGSYSVDGSRLTIEMGPLTLATCPPGSRSDDFITYLGSATSYFFENSNLYIDLAADAGTMTLAPAETIAADDGDGGTNPETTPEGSSNDGGSREHATGTYQAPYYVIASGDTLSSIGQRFGIAWQDIAAANGVKDTLIYPGQTLLIPDGSTPITTAPEQGEAERVSFQAGSVSDSRSEMINQGIPKSYILTISKGQTITVETTSNGEPLVISIGNTLGDLLPVEGTNSQINNRVSVVLPEAGDFIVSVRPLTVPENPQLAFDITFTIR